MNWDDFVTEYQGLWRNIKPDEITVWKKRVNALMPADVLAAFGVIEQRLLDKPGRYHPKIGEIEAEAKKAERARLAHYEPKGPHDPCGLCDDTGVMCFCGNRTGRGNQSEYHLGEYDYNETKFMGGKPSSGGIPCVCIKGRAEKKGFTAAVVEWRTNAMPILAKRFGAVLEGGAIYEAGIIDGMIKAWDEKRKITTGMQAPSTPPVVSEEMTPNVIGDEPDGSIPF